MIELNSVNNELEYEVIMVTPIEVEIMYTSILFYAILWFAGQDLFLGILLGSFWAIQESMLFWETFYALMLVRAGVVVARTAVVEIIAHFWPVF